MPVDSVHIERTVRVDAGRGRHYPGPVRRSDGGWMVYLLRCGDRTLYTGCTNDLPLRLDRHAAGRGARYTRSRLPVRLVYAERAPDRGAALRREAAIKRLTRAAKLALIEAARAPRPAPRRRRRAVTRDAAAGGGRPHRR